VLKAALRTSEQPPQEIDRRVRETLHQQGGLYVLDEPLLREVKPDLILTQDRYDVCTPPRSEVEAVAAKLPGRPAVLSLDPRTLEDVFLSILEIGKATRFETRARDLVEGYRARVKSVRSALKAVSDRPRVMLMDWLDPVFACGHWNVEMVEAAGGREVLGRPGEDSRRIEWSEVLKAAPEVICLTPCACHLDTVVRQAIRLPEREGWPDLPAVRTGRVFACDADSYFTRPSPRVVEGIELLAHLIHPEAFGWSGPVEAFQRL
jgi:iron complex transport system substrate-binding protein